MFDSAAAATSLLATPLPDSGTGDISVAVLAVMVPIVAIVMGIGMGMLTVWLSYRKKREIVNLHHIERMAAIEKGIELPPLPPEFFKESSRVRAPANYLRGGLMWLLIGAAIVVALFAASDNEERKQALWGLVPMAYGAANLLFYIIEGRRKPAIDDKSAGSNPPGMP